MATVNTDSWGYDRLVDVGYDRHFRVRHGQGEFVQDASHINGIESFWSFAKARLHQFYGASKETFKLHLKGCEFRFNHRYEEIYKFLLFLNGKNRPIPGGQLATVAQGEFKKLVYESTFTKLAGGMSFVNSKPDAFPGLGKQDFRGRGEVQIVPPLSGIRPLT